ncbi:multicopper oxidase [Staphylococcus aureus]|nr:multicopper oxidase [Staphylococcus aureus]
MYNKVFTILIIIFSIIIIASNDTFAESKNDMMNMKEDKKNTMDMTNMKHHDERKK